VVIGRHGCQKEINVHMGDFVLECKKGDCINSFKSY
jgi:hypothetical protein